MNSQDLLNAALTIPKARFNFADTIIVCDFCEEEVRITAPDSVYYCDDHGCVEAYCHEVPNE